MDLAKLPIRLPDDARDAWKKHVLSHVGGDLSSLEEALAEKLGSNQRARLSRFLNGHGEEIYQWLRADREPRKGEEDRRSALLSVLDADGDLLVEHLASLIPVELGGPRLSLADLSAFPLPVRVREIRTVWDALSEHSENSTFPELRQARPASPLRMRLPAMPIQPLAESLLQHFVDSQPTSPTPERLSIELFPGEITAATVISWLEALVVDGRISRDTVAAVRAMASLDGLFLLRSAGDLIAAVQDFADARISDFSATTLARRRVEWARQRVLAFAPGLISRWVVGAKSFFVGWLREAGALDESLPISAVLHLLESTDVDRVPDSKDAARDVLWALRSKGDEEIQSLAFRAFLAHFPDDVLEQLHEAELIVGTTNELRLSNPLRALAEAELPFALRAKDLEEVFALWNDRLLVDTLRICASDQLDAMAVLCTLDRIDQPILMIALLRGLAARESSEEIGADALEKLWASAVWATSHHLGQDPQLSPYGVEVLRFISERFAHRLPTLDDRDIVGDLRSRASTAIVAACEARTSKAPQAGQIFALAPFQIAHELSRTRDWWSHLEPDFANSGRLSIRLAGLGDVDARRWVARRPDFAEQVDLRTLLAWVPDLARRSVPRITARAFERYLEGDAALFIPLATALRVTTLAVESELEALDALDEGYRVGSPMGLRPVDLNRLRAAAELTGRIASLQPLCRSETATEDELRWARTWDDGALHRWCEEHGLLDVEAKPDETAICELVDELESAERAWDWLSPAAQTQLLLSLGKGVSRRWILRGAMLTPADGITFAQKHGTWGEIRDALERQVAALGTSDRRLQRWAAIQLNRPATYDGRGDDVAHFRRGLASRAPRSWAVPVLDLLLGEELETIASVGATPEVYWSLLRDRVVQKVRLDIANTEDPVRLVASSRVWLPLHLDMPADFGTMLVRDLDNAALATRDPDLTQRVTAAFLSDRNFTELKDHLLHLRAQGLFSAMGRAGEAVLQWIPTDSPADEVVAFLGSISPPSVLADYLDRASPLKPTPDLLAVLLQAAAATEAGPVRGRLRKRLEALI